MRPVLFWVKGTPVYSYGTMLALAFVVGIYLTWREGKRVGLSIDAVLDLAIVVSLTALVGSRLGYILLEMGRGPLSWRDVFDLREGGLSFHGGLAGGFLGGAWYCKRLGRSLWEIADLVTPAIPVGYSIVRVGCLLNGCCYGYPSTVPWAFACSAMDTLSRHPTQLYSLGLSLLIFFIIWRKREDRPFDGYLFMLYTGLYSITRFLVEFFRESEFLFGWMKVAQFVSAIVALLSFGYMGVRLWQRRGRMGKGM